MNHTGVHSPLSISHLVPISEPSRAAALGIPLSCIEHRLAIHFIYDVMFDDSMIMIMSNLTSNGRKFLSCFVDSRSIILKAKSV